MNRFENGFDSYKKAIIELGKRNNDEFKLKTVILNYHHAIEVLFKYILDLKGEYLIYRDMNNWVNAKFDRKISKKNNRKETTNHTISFDETIKRVIVFYDEEIDQYTYNGFLNLNKLRNALTHNEVDLEIGAVEQIIVTLTPIVTAILQKYLTGEEKETFDDFVSSEQYKEILQQLIGNNLAWRIITVSNLLELYSNKNYDNLSRDEIRHLELTLSLLNIIIQKEGMFFYIDNEYYITYISYLKQEICDLLIQYLKIIEKNKEIKNVIKRTNIIKNIMQEYLINATSYVYNLLNDKQQIPFEQEKSIYTILESNSFVNNNDIYTILSYIKQIIDVLVMITGAKKREVLLEKIYIDEAQKVTVELIYSTLISWFSKNNWFNSINIEKLDENIRNKIQSDDMYEEIEEKIWGDELYHDLIGEFGEWSFIHRIDYITVEQLETVVKSDNITLVYSVSFSTQTYSDHEYYDNGVKDCLIKIIGNMKGNRFIIDEADYMGYETDFRYFKFN